MGSFANTLFSVLLGWIRSAAATLWSAVFDGRSSGFWEWAGNNWITLVVILCVIGTAIDWTVHLIRWRPLAVWASFFRRIGRRNGSGAARKQLAPVPQVARMTVSSGQSRQKAPVRGLEDYPLDPVLTAEETSGKRHYTADLVKHVKSLPHSLQMSGSAAEEKIVYQPAQPSVDARDAYREPVYPEEWTPTGRRGVRS